MKKILIKFVVCLVTAVLLSTGLVPFNGAGIVSADELPKLPTLKYLNWDIKTGILTWQIPEVGDNVKYEFRMDGEILSTGGTSEKLIFPMEILESGTYTYTLINSNVEGWIDSDPITTMEWYYTKPEASLEKAKNLRWRSDNRGIAEWDAVEGAWSYQVWAYREGEEFTIGGDRPDNGEPWVDLSMYMDEPGNYTFEVVALSNNLSERSSSISDRSSIFIKDGNSHINPQQENTMKVGDYVTFGKYLGEPILWRVIYIDKDGSPMLFSEKILCIKPFDAAESGKFNLMGADSTFTPERFRKELGSNKWENSNIREWLNSSEKNVKYTTQPPINEAVEGGLKDSGLNDYADEAGFLNGFTEGERAVIKEVTHKAILADYDKKENTGGTEIHSWEMSIAGVTANYDKAYYKDVKDKVFLLDVKELDNCVFKRGWEIKKTATEKAISDNENKEMGLNTKDSWDYWLRTPFAESADSVRDATRYGNVSAEAAVNSQIGVVPALNLLSANIKAGKGTLEEPYVPEDGKAASVPKENAKGDIKIISVIPDKNLKPNSEVKFKVKVKYSFEGSEQAILYLGFNTKKVNGYRIVDEKIVKEKSGEYTFEVSTNVKDWGEQGEFKAFVNISEYPHGDDWSPIGDDSYKLEVVK